MNILIVDDQVNVISGLMSNIDFQKLGFRRIASATNAEDALKILEREQIHVLLSDIEMPGRNGLELNAVVREKYPDILRILLTSHTNFDYAKEGLKLGCFDYLVQPAPYVDIEASLANAVVQLKMNAQREKMNSLGTLFDTHRTEFLNSSMMNLFSRHQENWEEGIRLLNEAGYALTPKSTTKMMLVGVLEAGDMSKSPSSHESIMTIKAVAEGLDLPEYVSCLVGKNRYDQFVVLFFSDKMFRLPTAVIETMYARMENSLHSQISCYVGWTARLTEIRRVCVRLHETYKDNIARKPELVYVHPRAVERVPTSLDGFISRWDTLLRAGKKSLLEKDIHAFLDRNLANSTSGFQDLCVLHQKLTQMFFNYFYENKVNILALFNDEMTYEKFMYSYNSTESIKEAVDFLLATVDQPVRQEDEPGYVERAKTYILENSDKMLTVKDISKYISLNPEYFTRLFKKETGYNIKDYIIQCKLTMAKDLLVNSNLPISMVALELGYSNFSHFTQMFKRCEGMTPKDYRAKYKK